MNISLKGKEFLETLLSCPSNRFVQNFKAIRLSMCFFLLILLFLMPFMDADLHFVPFVYCEDLWASLNTEPNSAQQSLLPEDFSQPGVPAQGQPVEGRDEDPLLLIMKISLTLASFLLGVSLGMNLPRFPKAGD